MNNNNENPDNNDRKETGSEQTLRIALEKEKKENDDSENEDANSNVIQATENDWVIQQGNNKLTNENKRYKNFLEENHERFKDAFDKKLRSRKTDMINKAIKLIVDNNGRFLKRTAGGGYYIYKRQTEDEDKLVRKTIGNHLRNLYTTKNPDEKQKKTKPYDISLFNLKCPPKKGDPGYEVYCKVIKEECERVKSEQIDDADIEILGEPNLGDDVGMVDMMDTCNPSIATKKNTTKKAAVRNKTTTKNTTAKKATHRNKTTTKKAAVIMNAKYGQRKEGIKWPEGIKDQPETIDLYDLTSSSSSSSEGESDSDNDDDQRLQLEDPIPAVTAMTQRQEVVPSRNQSRQKQNNNKKSNNKKSCGWKQNNNKKSNNKN